LALVLVGAMVGRNVGRSIDKIVKSFEMIAGGRFDVDVDDVRRDEFGVLGKHLRSMSVALAERERIRNMFGRYVSEGVARKVLGDSSAATMDGEEREVTILFSDIRNYSTISEYLNPAQVVALLNEYMGEMSNLVDDDGGCVIEFLGDAILAVFGAPELTEDHAERAVQCALKMDARLAAMNARWEASGFADLWKRSGVAQMQARIGVHTGRVVAGNMGGPTRMKYAVIGDAVNVASRIEQLNSQLETRVLITQSVLDRRPPEIAKRAQSRGEHVLKGRAQSVHVYTF
jgi:adenylate cyclase